MPNMGDFLQDLFIGQQYVAPQHEGPWPEDVERLREQIARMQEQPGFGVPFSPGPLLQALGARQEGEIEGPQLTPLGERLLKGKEKTFGQYELESQQRAGLQREATQEEAQQSIEARRALEEAAKQTKQAKEAETQRMQEEAYQRQLDAITDLPADKLRRIRAEARAKGRAGSLGAAVEPTAEDFTDIGGGGTFSQQQMTPELEQRLAERDQWVADQPMRNMAFYASPEQARRNPELAMAAAQRLSEMKEQQGRDYMRKLQMALVSKLGRGGKVPYSKAMQLEAAGIDVPAVARGSHPDVVKQAIQQVIAESASDVEKLRSDPSTMVSGGGMGTASYLMYVQDMGQRYIDQLERGRDPDEAWAEFSSIVQQQAINSGSLAYWEMLQQQQQQTQGE